MKETRWWIPLTYTDGNELDFGNTRPRLWLKPDDDITVLKDMPDDKQFVLMNLQAAGAYSINFRTNTILVQCFLRNLRLLIKLWGVF